MGELKEDYCSLAEIQVSRAEGSIIGCARKYSKINNFRITRQNIFYAF